MSNYMIADKSGNRIYSIKDSKAGMITVSLQLASEKRERMLGYIDLRTKMFHVKRDKEKHLFRKLNAYGFNYYVIEHSKLFDWINLSDGENSWLIPKSFFTDKSNHNKFLHFKGSGGFELQIFAPLDEIEKFKTL